MAEQKESDCCKMIEVPYVVHESEVARAERNIKRLWIALIVSISLIFVSNAAWLIYESKFESFLFSQDGDGINSVNYGEQGDLNNGSNSESETKAGREG